MVAIDDGSSDRLKDYRSKRSAGATPEPFAGSSSATGKTFVVQKHAARRIHYDFRLEFGGVLKSWAVPKGPSFDPADKRLAVMTEDHPVDYADFEGIIPEGNYGAGAVIVWDQGVWVPKEDFEAGLERGKLLFELHGYKLYGLWTLVKLKKTEKEWLLIKERDAWAAAGGEPPVRDASVFSGLLVEELRDGCDRAGPLREALTAAGAPKRPVAAKSVALMKAQVCEGPFSDRGWLFELKYDGYRLLAAREGSQPLLLSRQGHDITATFPEIAKVIPKLPIEDFILDGEVVVHDEEGRPSFQRLQKRGRLTRRIEIQRAAMEYPAVLYVFDLIAAEGYDLRTLPLETRKSLLREMLPTAGPLRYSDHVAERGEDFFEQVRKMALEGVVAKRIAAPYQGGRSPDWLKIRLDRTDDFVVAGFSEPKGSRTGIGALHLAAYDGGQLLYAGSVGTGFTVAQLDELGGRLEAAAQPRPACRGDAVPTGERHHWVTPDLVCEVRYKEWPVGGLLRHPVFLRMRDDKPVEDCVRPGGEPVFGTPEPISDDSPRPLVPFSNLEKIFWPDEGYSKGDLIEYYRSIAQWLLPYLKDRPVVLTRYPDGITGKSFFQKDAPDWTPDWIRKETMWSEDSGKETNYFVCEDVESLMYIINLGAIPLHVWSSRVGSLERPDWCILDLDPKEAAFRSVVAVANAIRGLCDEIELPCFVKTSGSTGLHVLLPLGGQCTYQQSKSLGELLGRVTAGEVPEIATTTRSLSARRGRVYIDFVQNGHGKLLVAPLSARPLPAAPVSMPLRWSDINDDLSIDQFTIKTAPDRLRAMKSDPLLPVLTMKADLAAALEKLARRLA